MVIDGDKEITPGVSVLLTPGHSPGCQSVMVETEEGKAIITGFCCIREHFEPPEGMHSPDVLIPGVNVNSLQAYDSVIRVKELADIVIPVHERDIAEKF
jgi:glyoxylase-like metal-dependent hydrolase (beta-lactamase superfamily II)